MKHVLIFLITLYQIFFPIRGYCRFHPTCSQYAKTAISKYGVVKGSWLTILRLLSCQPFTKPLATSH